MAEKKVIHADHLHRYRTNPDFVLRRIGAEAVLIPTGETGIGNSMLSVNETFGFLWELFSEPTSFETALQKAREEYVDSAGEMEKHIASFLLDCVKYGMITQEE